MTYRAKILYIENEKSWINIARKVLVSCDVEGALTCIDAQIRLESGEHYDLALINLNFTDDLEAAGEEMLEYIRDRHPSLPRIIITGAMLPVSYATYVEEYQVEDILNKRDYIGPQLRRIVSKVLKPFRTGEPELREKKQKLVIQLNELYDQKINALNQKNQQLNDFASSIRKLYGLNRAEEATKEDHAQLERDKDAIENRYKELYLQIRGAIIMQQLEVIENEFDKGW